jgi:hypothetical protein
VQRTQQVFFRLGDVLEAGNHRIEHGMEVKSDAKERGWK